MKCEQEREWLGCYSGTFDLITPESIAHPAKMSVPLLFKIIGHLEELGLLKSGDTILDPMGGTGLTGIVANARGYSAITVELESRFVEFQKQNKLYAERKLHKSFNWQILQGDSRYLSQILKEKGLITVTSPPYGEAISSKQNGIDLLLATNPKDRRERHDHSQTAVPNEYSSDPSNIGNLVDKPLVTVTSPPYDNRFSDRDTRADRPPSCYSQDIENLGNKNGESYLQAMQLVYSEIAKVSNVLAIVLKNPTRNGKIRRLDLDTISLLEKTGWRIHCHHEARLFEEIEQPTLFGGTKKRLKGRVSFFKLLSYQKGSPVADHEDILVCVREGVGMVSITSPPYAEAQTGGGICIKGYNGPKRDGNYILASPNFSILL